jgi:hypothetical protein
MRLAIKTMPRISYVETRLIASLHKRFEVYHLTFLRSHIFSFSRSHNYRYFVAYPHPIIIYALTSPFPLYHIFPGYRKPTWATK